MNPTRIENYMNKTQFGDFIIINILTKGMAQHTLLPGTKSIVGPPVTSTATTPASWKHKDKEIIFNQICIIYMAVSLSPFLLMNANLVLNKV